MAKVTILPVVGRDSLGTSERQMRTSAAHSPSTPRLRSGQAPLRMTRSGRDPTINGGAPRQGADETSAAHGSLVQQQIAAGFPSPADDYLKAETPLDLNEHLIKHPAATFFVRVRGDSMTGCGIFPDDILIVDRSLEAIHRKVVIAVVNGELTVKRLYKSGGKVMLMPENDGYKPIVIEDNMELEIWGVVTCVIHGL